MSWNRGWQHIQVSNEESPRNHSHCTGCIFTWPKVKSLNLDLRWPWVASRSSTCWRRCPAGAVSSRAWGALNRGDDSTVYTGLITHSYNWQAVDPRCRCQALFGVLFQTLVSRPALLNRDQFCSPPPPRRRLAMSGDVLSCHQLGGTGEMQPASRGAGQGHRGTPKTRHRRVSTPKTWPGRNVSSAEAESAHSALF